MPTCWQLALGLLLIYCVTSQKPGLIPLPPDLDGPTGICASYRNWFFGNSTRMGSSCPPGGYSMSSDGNNVRITSKKSSKTGSIVIKLGDLERGIFLPGNFWAGIAVYKTISQVFNDVNNGTFPGMGMMNVGWGSTSADQCTEVRNGFFERTIPDTSHTFSDSFTHTAYEHNYYGFMKIERLENVVNSYYSDDARSWTYLTQFKDFNESESLYYGVFYSNPEGTEVSVPHLEITGFGVESQCANNPCNFVTGLCTNATIFVECGYNQWRYSYLTTAMRTVPIITIRNEVISLESVTTPDQRIETQPSDDQLIFVHKLVSGNGKIRFQIPNFGSGMGFVGVMARFLHTSGTKRLTEADMFACVLFPSRFTIQGITRGALPIYRNSFAQPNYPTDSYSLILEREGNFFKCGYQVSMNEPWQYFHDASFVANPVQMQIGMIFSTKDGEEFGASVKKISYSDFSGYCNNRATSCGVYSETSIKLDECICSAGYTGKTCEFNVCWDVSSDLPDVCSGHGVCTGPNNCTCNSGWTGFNCSIPTCGGIPQETPYVCTGRGACIAPDQCVCSNSTLHSGNLCQHFNCYGISGGDPNVCSRNGRCDSLNNCTCFTDNVGIQCESFVFEWIGDSGNWTTISNWKFSTTQGTFNATRYPGLGDIVFISKVGVYTVNLNIPNFELTDLTVGKSNSITGNRMALSCCGRDLKVHGSLNILDSGMVQFENMTTTMARLVIQGGKIDLINTQANLNVSGSIENSAFGTAVLSFTSASIFNVYGTLNSTHFTTLSISLATMQVYGTWNRITTSIDIANQFEFVLNVYGAYNQVGGIILVNKNVTFALGSTIKLDGTFMTTTSSHVDIATNIFGTGTLDTNGPVTILNKIPVSIYSMFRSGGKLTLLHSLDVYNTWIHNSDVLIFNSGVLLIRGSTKFNDVIVVGNAPLYDGDGTGSIKILAPVQWIGPLGDVLSVKFKVVVQNLLTVDAILLFELPSVFATGGSLLVRKSWSLSFSQAVTMSSGSLGWFGEGTVQFNAPLTWQTNGEIAVTTKQNAVISMRSESVLKITTNTFKQLASIQGSPSRDATIRLESTFECFSTLKDLKVLVFSDFDLRDGVLQGIDMIIGSNSDVLSAVVASTLRITQGSESASRISDSTFSNSGNILIGRSITIDTSTITNNPDGVFSQSSGTLSGSARIVNLGQLQVSSSEPSNNMVNLLTIENHKKILVTSSRIGFGSIQAQPWSQFVITSSNITSYLNITNGYLTISGSVSPSLRYDSNTGIMKLLPKQTLEVTQNFTLGKKGILFLIVDSYDGKNAPILANNTLIEGLVYAKLTQSVSPTIGTLYPLFDSLVHMKGIIALNGASFRSGVISQSDRSGKLLITSSFGAAEQQDYQCHYLGNARILEYNYYKDTDSMSITFTGPRSQQFGWSGYGIDTHSGSLNNSIMVVTADGSNFFNYLNHASFDTMDTVLDSGSNVVDSFFRVGLPFQTVNLFVQRSSIRNQSKVFYAEGFLNSTNSNETIKSNMFLKHYYAESMEFTFFQSKTLNCTNFLAPSRYEVFSPAGYAIIVIIYVILFILCCIFYRWQPLNSRGISPFLTLGFLMIQILLEMRNFFTPTAPQASLCLHYAYGIYPMMQICFIMIFLYFLRYFAIINFNQTKNENTGNAKFGLDHVWKIRILKFITNSWFTLGFLAASFVGILIINTIILASSSFTCQFEILMALKIINNVDLIIIYTLTLIALLTDVISNWKLTLKCHWITYIIKKDPYYFRIQVFLFIPFMIYNLATEIANVVLSSSYVNILTHFELIAIFFTVTYTCVLFLDVVFPLVLTIWHLFLRLCRKKKMGNVTFDILLADPDMYKAFENFCKAEFAVENFLCYNDICEFKKNKSKKDPMVMYKMYFSGSDALYEVNVSKSHCVEILHKIESGSYDESLFDTITNTILTNLGDTYSRFVFSTVYTEWEQRTKFTKELIEGK